MDSLVSFVISAPGLITAVVVAAVWDCSSSWRWSARRQGGECTLLRLLLHPRRGATNPT
jgi:hypothetical protein